MKRVIRIGTKLWFAKKNDGFNPASGMARSFGTLVRRVNSPHQSSQTEGHHASACTPLLDSASEDHLVKTEMGSQVLERELRPVECLIMESGHGVNVEKASRAQRPS